MPLFISRGTDRKTRRELTAIRKALERLADVAELHFNSGGPSLRSFYKDASPKSVDEAELSYVDEEEAWLNEQAERAGVTVDEIREAIGYAVGSDLREDRKQDADDR